MNRDLRKRNPLGTLWGSIIPCGAFRTRISSERGELRQPHVTRISYHSLCKRSSRFIHLSLSSSKPYSAISTTLAPNNRRIVKKKTLLPPTLYILTPYTYTYYTRTSGYNVRSLTYVRRKVFSVKVILQCAFFITRVF